MGYNPFISLVKQGDPVTPGSVNRPLQGLAQDVQYIYDLLQAAAIGATVVAPQASVEPAALQGMPVYFNPVTARFERALAQAETQPVSGQILTAPSSLVWGVVLAKTNTAVADILLYGYASLDISAAVTGPVMAGVYYLSGTVSGMLAQQRPPVSVIVLRADGQGKVFVTPQLIDLLDRHVHLKFPLFCLPAGITEPPGAGERHVITGADTSLPGWLPADDPSFAGAAPAGFSFGYNLAAHPELKAVWPPLPPGQAYLEWDKGLSHDVGGTGVPLGPEGAVVINRDGIWWRSDCFGDVPWPADYSSLAPPAFSDSLSAGAFPCPRPLEMALTLWFSRINFETDLTVVTSLRSLSPRLKVQCAGGTPGAVGDLTVTLDLDLTVTADQPGYSALKAFDPATAEFQAGPVVEGIYSEGSNVTLSGNTSRHVDPTDLTSPLAYQGLVGLSVNPAPTQEIDVQLVRLDVVTESYFQDILYLGFPAGDDSSIRAKIYIPEDAPGAAPTLSLSFTLMGRLSGGLPALTLTARRLPQGTATPTDLPLTDNPVVIDTTATLAAANQYVEITSAAFAVAAGDTVFVSLSRSGSDSYPGEVGLIRMTGVLAAGS